MVKIYKEIRNTEIADLLRAISVAYQIKDEQKNRFRIIAYDRAADAVEHLSSEAKDLWDDGKLEEVAGIGESIASHLAEIFKNGKSKHFEKVMKGISPAVFDLIPVPGLGPSNSQKLVEKFNLSPKNPLVELLAAAKQGKIEHLEGFGKGSQAAIIKDIEDYLKREKRLLLNYANKIADEIIIWMKKCNYVERVDPLGSLRRKASTIGDLDISIASDNPLEIIKHFINYPKIQRVIEKGDKTASILIPGDIQVDLMVGKPESYGSLLQHFTGSKHHNIALREFANKNGLSLSEYGIRKVNSQNSSVKCFTNEQEFYHYLGMEWIPPELREDAGEISAALNKKLPDLVELSDIKSDLQIHSDFDIETSHDLGESSIKEIVDKANLLGYEYIALTEHNPSRGKHNNRQIIDLIKKKKDVIDKVNNDLVNSRENELIKVFNSLEVDILKDGSLPVSEEALNLLDFALVSIHSSFNLSRFDMTKRIINAFNHPKVRIFAHPTARKLNEREGIEIDWDIIFTECRRRDIWLEINADPMRLDLPDVLVKDAINHGVKLTLGTDAHNTQCMEYMTYGVSVARRGWAEKNDIINTKSLEMFKKMIE